MDHLDEMPGTVRSGMDIAILGARIAAVAARRALCIAEPRRQRLEDRIETIDDGFVAADHQAIAALETHTPPLVPTSTWWMLRCFSILARRMSSFQNVLPPSSTISPGSSSLPSC